MKDAHVALILAHYPSIGHAIVDVKKNNVNSKAYELISGDESNVDKVLNMLKGAFSSIVDKLAAVAVTSKSILDANIDMNVIVSLESMLRAIATGGKRVGTHIISKFFKYIGTFWSYVKSIFTGEEIATIEKEDTGIQSLWKSYGTAIYGIFKAFASAVNTLFTVVYKAIKSAAKLVLDALFGVISQTVETGNTVGNVLYKSAIKTTMYICSLGNDLFQVVNTKFVNKVDEYISTISLSVIQQLMGFANYVSSKIDFIAEIVLDLMNNPYVATLVETITLQSASTTQLLLYIVGKSTFATNVYQKVTGLASNIITDGMQLLTNAIAALFKPFDSSDDPTVTVSGIESLMKKMADSPDAQEILNDIGELKKTREKSIATKYEGTWRDVLSRAVKRASVNSNMYTDAYLGDTIELPRFDEFFTLNTGFSYEEYTMNVTLKVEDIKTSAIESTLLKPEEVEKIQDRAINPAVIRIMDEKRKKLRLYMQQLNKEITNGFERSVAEYKTKFEITDENIQTLKQLGNLLKQKYEDLIADTNTLDTLYNNNKRWWELRIIGGIAVGLIVYGVSIYLSRVFQTSAIGRKNQANNLFTAFYYANYGTDDNKEFILSKIDDFQGINGVAVTQDFSIYMEKFKIFMNTTSAPISDDIIENIKKTGFADTLTSDIFESVYKASLMAMVTDMFNIGGRVSPSDPTTSAWTKLGKSIVNLFAPGLDEADVMFKTYTRHAINGTTWLWFMFSLVKLIVLCIDLWVAYRIKKSENVDDTNTLWPIFKKHALDIKWGTITAVTIIGSLTMLYEQYNVKWWDGLDTIATKLGLPGVKIFSSAASVVPRLQLQTYTWLANQRSYFDKWERESPVIKEKLPKFKDVLPSSSSSPTPTTTITTTIPQSRRRLTDLKKFNI